MKQEYDPATLQRFRDYYGAPPEVLEGFINIKQAEKQECFMRAEREGKDLTHLTPVRANLPFTNVLLDGFKLRAMIDTGSTTTLVSSGVFKELS